MRIQLNWLTFILCLIIVLYIYGIYKYGFVGYAKRRIENKQKRSDYLINLFE